MSEIRFSYPVAKAENVPLPGVDLHSIDPNKFERTYIPDQAVGHMLDGGSALCGVTREGEQKIVRSPVAGREVCPVCLEVYKTEHVQDPEMIRLLNWANGGHKLFKHDVEVRRYYGA